MRVAVCHWSRTLMQSGHVTLRLSIDSGNVTVLNAVQSTWTMCSSGTSLVVIIRGRRKMRYAGSNVCALGAVVCLKVCVPVQTCGLQVTFYLGLDGHIICYIVCCQQHAGMAGSRRATLYAVASLEMESPHGASICDSAECSDSQQRRHMPLPRQWTLAPPCLLWKQQVGAIKGMALLCNVIQGDSTPTYTTNACHNKQPGNEVAANLLLAITSCTRGSDQVM